MPEVMEQEYLGTRTPYIHAYPEAVWRPWMARWILKSVWENEDVIEKFVGTASLIHRSEFEFSVS